MTPLMKRRVQRILLILPILAATALILLIVVDQLQKRARTLERQRGLQGLAGFPSQPETIEKPPLTALETVRASLPQWIGGFSPSELYDRDPYRDYRSPLHFYGRFEDENGNPIPAVEVTFTWGEGNPSATKEVLVYSDSNGRFSLTDRKGAEIKLTFSANGYIGGMAYFQSIDRNNPDYYRPSRRKPVVIKLQKTH